MDACDLSIHLQVRTTAQVYLPPTRKIFCRRTKAQAANGGTKGEVPSERPSVPPQKGEGASAYHLCAKTKQDN